MEEASRLDAVIASLPESNGTHACPLTDPGIAPRNRRSGTSIASVAASRRGNKRLKNLLIFSWNRFDGYHRA